MFYLADVEGRPFSKELLDFELLPCVLVESLSLAVCRTRILWQGGRDSASVGQGQKELICSHYENFFEKHS